MTNAISLVVSLMFAALGFFVATQMIKLDCEAHHAFKLEGTIYKCEVIK